MAKRLSVEKVRKALIENQGLIIHTARTLGVHRSTLYEFLKKHPDLKDALDESRHYLIEHAEIILRQNLQNGSLPASMFVLRTLGGWTERLEIGHNMGADIPEIPTTPEARELGIEYLKALANK